jgi:hypothetical protein
MEETLVSYTTAVLAKEKGFNLRTESLYRSATQIIYSIHGYDFDIAAPTQTALQKWLRDVHKLHIEISCGSDTEFGVIYGGCETPEWVRDDKQEVVFFNTYEESLEEGLKGALELITK